MSVTRSGVVFKMIEESNSEVGDRMDDGRSESEVSNALTMEMMRLMVEDRRRRDEEWAEKRRQKEEKLAEERQCWLEERKIWVKSVEEERRRRNEDSWHKEELNQKQLDSLKSMVQESRSSGEAVRIVDSGRDVKFPKLTENDNIVAYLTTFERLMEAFEVKKES